MQPLRASNPDTLICGNCRECFSELSELLDHKKSYCKLRFTCKCQDVAFAAKTPPTGAKLLCAVCKDAFANPWDLMVHAQAAHMVNIYELGDEVTNSTNGNRSPNNGNVSDATNGHAAAAAAVVAAATVVADDEATAITKHMPTSATLNKEPNNNNKISNNNNNNNSTNINNNINGHSSPIAHSNNNNNSGSNIAAATAMDVAADADIDADAAAAAAAAAAGVAAVVANDGHVSGSDTETHCMDSGLCASPKEDQQRDDLSLDGRLSSSSQTHHSDDLNVNIKLINGSVSSRGSSPGLESDEPPATRACIVRTLSIEAAAAPATPTANALSLMSNGLSLALAPQ
ncbi:hypothetical protein AWZ03_000471 [Drosophila navojoa]|uniref:C2H2-type domain-containing protein n=1 Tax=Drosophila navojoa TaxID=7232 RepID=A0A484BVT4_DRONA|nr:hypothetical protein AWZ03_000471 [Drosophila navojoa]